MGILGKIIEEAFEAPVKLVEESIALPGKIVGGAVKGVEKGTDAILGEDEDER